MSKIRSGMIVYAAVAMALLLLAVVFSGNEEELKKASASVQISAEEKAPKYIRENEGLTPEQFCFGARPVS